jgi:excisionase family DNA binding protein
MAESPVTPIRWENAKEVAERLGITERTVGEMVRAGRIPCRRIPGSRLIRFNPAEVDAWMAGDNKAHNTRNGQAA